MPVVGVVGVSRGPGWGGAGRGIGGREVTKISRSKHRGCFSFRRAASRLVRHPRQHVCAAFGCGGPSGCVYYIMLYYLTADSSSSSKQPYSVLLPYDVRYQCVCTTAAIV